MNELTANVISDIAHWGRDAVLWFEAILPALKVLSIVVSGLFIWGIVYSVLKSGFHYFYSDQWYDRMGFTGLPERRARRAWAQVLQLIQNRTDRKQWIAAFEEAEKIVNEGLKVKGYTGVNFRERFERAREARELASLEELQNAHTTLLHAGANLDFPLTHEGAVQTLRMYKKIIKELGMFR